MPLVYFRDSFTGSGDPMGTPVEDTSATGATWEAYNTIRSANGLRASTSGNITGLALVSDTAPFPERPKMYVVEGTFTVGGYDSVTASMLQTKSDGTSFEVGPNIQHQSGLYLGNVQPSNYRVQTESGIAVLYSDETDYGPAPVKRRLEFEFFNNFDGYQFRAYANDVLLQTGWVPTSDMLDQQLGVCNVFITINKQTGWLGPPVEPYLKNFYGSVGDDTPPEPPVPSVFWTDFVNTYEVP